MASLPGRGATDDGVVSCPSCVSRDGRCRKEGGRGVRRAGNEAGEGGRVDAGPRRQERPTGEVVRPFLGFLSKEARETDNERVILVQEGREGVSQGGG